MPIPSLPFTGGSLQLYLKNQGMKLTMERKKQGLEVLNPKEREELTPREQEMQNIREQMAGIRKSNAIASITSKLDTGQDLTEDEMAHLRTHNPQLYQKALEIREEREAYKKSLRRCRTKEDAARLNTSKLQSFVAQTKGDAAQAHRRMMAVTDEHSAFVRSRRYQLLPTEQDIREKKRKKPLQDGGSELRLSALLPTPPAPLAAAAAKAAARLDIKV